MDTVYKEMDGKLVPIERFNLGRAKASVAYFRGQGKTEEDEFAVRRHPVCNLFLWKRLFWMVM
ncbi:hypothetical protein [Porphyromonas macacae]|uniref:hypothetical protein n=1 Tax=Porphyromonas macacae TaxID=28115 RepID=UPI000AF62442|nr:hypothetical protein [Porphyromonas macacae]